MSEETTSLIISMGTEDSERIRDINRYFWEVYATDNIDLIGIDDPALPRHWYGGNRFHVDGLYFAAYANLDLDRFVKYLRKLDWIMPYDVQVFHRKEYEGRFSVVNLYDIAENRLFDEYRQRSRNRSKSGGEQKKEKEGNDEEKSVPGD